jgi:hypothetical protein
MPSYPSGGWTGDPILDGSLWAMGVPLNGEMLLLDALDSPTGLLVDAMDRAIERGVPVWRLTDPPRGEHLLVESRRTIVAFLAALGWEEPPDHRFGFVEIAVGTAGRRLPDDVPEAFVEAFLAARVRGEEDGEATVDWPAPQAEVEAFLDGHGLRYGVADEGTYRVAPADELPGCERWREHRQRGADASTLGILDVWPPLGGEEERFGNEAIRERRDELR